MELSQLRVFRDIAHEHNFSRVARQHFITQPSVSARLKTLEAELGVKLVERAPRKVVLTQEGRLILPYVEELLEQYESIKSVIAQTREEPEGTLRLAATYSIGRHKLDHCLSRFIGMYPKIRVDLQYRKTEIIYDLLLKKKLDLGVVDYPAPRQGINASVCGCEEMVLVVPSDHALFNRKRISLRKIAGEAFVTFDEQMPIRHAIDGILKSRGIEVKVVSTNDNLDTLMIAVEAGQGVSILPAEVLSQSVGKGKVGMVHFSDCTLTRPVGMLTYANGSQSYPLKLFANLVKQGCAAKHN